MSTHSAVLIEGLLKFFFSQVPGQVADEQVALFGCSRVIF